MKNRMICAACWAVTALSAESATLARRPYLQDVRTTQASILWTTTGDSGIGEVVLSRGGGEVQRVPSTVTPFPPSETGLLEPFFQHRAVLRGLQSDTVYTYRVLLNGLDAIPGSGLELRTAGNGDHFRFLAIGDSGDGATGQQDVARLLLREQAALLLHTGDLAYYDGTFQQIEDYYFRTYWPLMRRIPFVAIPGNHDYNTGNGLAFRSSHYRDGGGPSTYYSFDWGNVHFVGIDTNKPFEVAVNGNGPLLEWLDQDLASARNMWRVAFFHHTPFPSAAHRGEPEGDLVLARLTPIIERHQVHLVLNGHEHLYQRTYPRRAGVFRMDSPSADPLPGTVYLTTGGGGSNVYDPGTDGFIQAGAGKSHYLRAIVEGARMTIQAVDRSGAVFDEFRLSARPVIDVSGIRDAAEGNPVIAGGGLVSVYGMNLATMQETAMSPPWPAALMGTRVLVNGIPAPLMFVSRGQLNLQLPFGSIGDIQVTVVTGAGEATRAAHADVAAPAVFRIVEGRESVPAITHLSGELVTARTPARAGEWLSIYMTGLGPVVPPIPAGTAASASTLSRTTLPVRVRAGAFDAEVSFAGLCPGFPGLYQVNFRVPASSGTLLQIEVGVASTAVHLVVE